MKVSRPHSPRQGGAPARLAGAGKGGDKGFAAKLQPTEGTHESRSAARELAPARHAVPVSDIGTSLGAGKISPGAAIDQAIERILDLQLGKHAGATLRTEVGRALRESLGEDPVLAAKVRALGRG